MDAASVHNEKRGSRTLERPLGHSANHTNGTITSLNGEDAATMHNHEVINAAIQAIGFGKFQWQLTFSCGFGFLVDQVRRCKLPDMRLLTLEFLYSQLTCLRRR